MAEAASDGESSLTIEDLRRIVENCRHGGPENSELQIPHLQATNAFITTKDTPLDLLREMPMTPGTSSRNLEGIGSAIQETVKLVTSHPVLKRMRGSHKAARYLGSLAVDAWRNSDLSYVKYFLMKGMFLVCLNTVGSTKLTSDSDHVRQLALRLELVILDETIKEELQRLTRGACRCVQLSEALREAAEENSPMAQQARREREIEQLPAILRPSSSYWKVKKQAAVELKTNQFGTSIKRYLEALGLLHEALPPSDRTPGPWSESRRKIVEEKGRIESNLSMIYASKLMDYDKALEHANNAVANDPRWPKAHSRRALALEGQGRLCEAEVAIAKAIDVLKEGTIGANPFPANATQAEYEKIASRIQSALERSGVVYDPVDPILILRISPEYAQAGAFTGCFETGVLERVAMYLSPRDVANLEQTCRGFAARPERMRRRAFSAPLWRLYHQHRKIEEYIEEYCSGQLHEPQAALRCLVQAVLGMVPAPKGQVPSWLRRILNFAKVDARNNIQSVCISHDETKWRGPLSVWAFENISSECRDILIDLHDGSLLPMFRNDEDSEILRIIAWLSPMLDDHGSSHPQLRDIQDQAFVMFSNLISRAAQQRSLVTKMTDQSSPSSIVKQAQAVTSIVSESFPLIWPCESNGPPDNWNYSAADIEAFFDDEPSRVLRSWMTALRELRQWAANCQCKEEELALIFLLTMIEQYDQHGTVPLNVFPIGLFAIKKSMEARRGGGRCKLRFQSVADVAEYVSDFYIWIRLYNVTLPKVREWRDDAVASSW